jgi:hypothetical protein
MLSKSTNSLLLAIFILTSGCQSHYSNDKDWYHMSQEQRTHIIDSDTHFIYELNKPVQSTYKGDKLRVSLIKGWSYQQQMRHPYRITPSSILLGYNSCKPLSLCAKGQTHCPSMMVCYQDDMVLLMGNRQQKRESIRIYRSILWHQNHIYAPINTPHPLALKKVAIAIELADSVEHQLEP